MTDVFISYAREDRELAHKLASALETRGWSVWWDRNIIAGQTFDQTIEHELEMAKSVVVLWSKDSITSDWVKNEAAVASERGVLVPAHIDNVKLPLEFRRKQTADLSGWNGNPSHGGFQALCEGIAAKADILGVAAPHQATTPRGLGFRWNHRLALGAITALTVALGFVAYGVFAPQQDRSSSRDEKIEPASPVVQPRQSEARGISNPVSIESGVPNFSSRDEKIEPVSPVIQPRQSEAHGINNPLSIELGVPNKVTLEKNEECYFKLSSPASNLKIFFDTRLADTTPKSPYIFDYSHLISSLSVLDQDGGVIKDKAIHFDKDEVGYRETALLFPKQPERFGFKLLNEDRTAIFWLTIVKGTDPRFVPFFGELTPNPLSIGKDRSGVLEANEYVYYMTPLLKGDYKVILDFSISKRKITDIKGYLALLGSDGGNQKEIIRIRETNLSYRKIAIFSVKKDEPLIIKVQNEGIDGVNYAVKIDQNR